MQYLVYQRRMMLEAMKTQAMCIAYVNPEGAQDAMKAYLDIAMPIDPEQIAAAERDKERQLDDVANMGAFSLDNFSFGTPITGDENVTGGSMHRPNR